VTDGLNWDEVYRGLQEVLDSLNDVSSSHPSLNSADILHLTSSIISNVRGLFIRSCMFLTFVNVVLLSMFPLSSYLALIFNY